MSKQQRRKRASELCAIGLGISNAICYEHNPFQSWVLIFILAFVLGWIFILSR